MVHFFSIYVIVLLINSYHARRRIIQHFPSSLGDERYPELSSRLFEGDILMPHGEDTKNAIISPKLKWPGGVILYEFTTNYTETEKEKVIRSMDLIESKTCIKFRKRQCDEEVYILINKMAGRGCFALIGHRPQYSPMLVNLQAPECLLYSGTIQHELLHVIGLFHEQARADRDEYVEIVWDNVEEDHYFDFSKAPPGYTTTYNVPYNLYSIMHYPNIAFSKNGQPTIISKKDPKNTDMGQREGVTEGDLEKVRRMYHCKNTNPSNESNNNNQISNIFNIFNIFKVN